MEQTKLRRFKRIIQTKFVIITVFMLSIGIDCNATANMQSTNTVESSIKMTHKDSIATRSRLVNDIVDEVSKYMSIHTKNRHNKLIPKYLVQEGLKNNIDICFMMAQTQVETCYGTLGAGRESSRRSLFGVAIHKYVNYEAAITHYCQILKKSYLTKGRNEQHLMTKYVTTKGARYASNPMYERDLQVAYKHIKQNTNIFDLQQKYKKYMTI